MDRPIAVKNLRHLARGQDLHRAAQRMADAVHPGDAVHHQPRDRQRPGRAAERQLRRRLPCRRSRSRLPGRRRFRRPMPTAAARRQAPTPRRGRRHGSATAGHRAVWAGERGRGRRRGSRRASRDRPGRRRPAREPSARARSGWRRPPRPRACWRHRARAAARAPPATTAGRTVVSGASAESSAVPSRLTAMKSDGAARLDQAGGMDDRVGAVDQAPQRCFVREIAQHDVGLDTGERGQRRPAADQQADLPAATGEGGNEMRADEAGGAGDRDQPAHEPLPQAAAVLGA